MKTSLIKEKQGKSNRRTQLAMQSIDSSRDERNVSKSRYRDVIPGEATRVRLQPDGDEKGDFINANYVSGYNNQERAYIFTQGRDGGVFSP